MKDLLFDEPYRFEFFQAVRVLERLYPHREIVGEFGSPSGEVVRFRSRVSLEFPASQIHEMADPRAEGHPPEMTVAFAGLTGPLGVLPASYTELLLERVRYKDYALHEFLDLFTHRAISLFHRAWEKYRFPIAYERTGEERFTESLYDLIGMGTPALRGRMKVADQALLYYAGLIAQKPHSATAIESIIADYFGVPLTVQQFVLQWLPLDGDSLTRLGAANSRLGADLVCGSRIPLSQSKFRLRFGPLTFREFLDFLPRGSAFPAAVELSRLLAGLEYDFDIQPVLKASEIPPCQLSSESDRPPMLGWTTWLTTRPPTQDATEVILEVN